MAATQRQIDALAVRIERAYRFRRPGWQGKASTARVWTAAASRLVRLHEGDADCPDDPELFVASQPLDSCFPDPWRELTSESAAGHYRRRVKAIIRALRAELRREVRLAERRVEAGQPIATVLSAECRRLSPLGRYITAIRAGRPALARRFHVEAAEQHRSCPLYRPACRGLVAAEAYPSSASPTGSNHKAPTTAGPRAQVHLMN